MKIRFGPGVLAFAVCAPLTLAAQQSASGTTPTATPSAPPGFEIPKATESPEHTALAQRHLRYIRRMIEEHKYLIAGPLLDAGTTQGLAIISAPNAGEAKRIAEGDPAIAAGHMAIELHPAMLPSMASLVVKY
jgi:uncharacterized protein YciI